VRVVFLGSPEFAVPSLESLVENDDIEVSLVVTQPDRSAGRGRKLRPPPVKIAAESYGLSVLQPYTLRDPEVVERIREVAPDLIVVVSYGEILRKNVLELPRYGCLNIHPSLLPRYRGAIPIQAAILNGDEKTGVSVMKLVRRMDAGPVLYQEDVPLVGNETAGTLSTTLSQLAANRLPGVIQRWVNGEINTIEQDEHSATYTRELKKADAQIDWRSTATAIERFIRAMDPWPRAWTLLGKQRMSILAASLDCDAPEGEAGAVIIDEDGVQIATGNGCLRLETVQVAGKKAMSATEWARGIRETDELHFANLVSDRLPIIFTRQH
jgi:methionyl-tRNA formyltransferase